MHSYKCLEMGPLLKIINQEKSDAEFAFYCNYMRGKSRFSTHSLELREQVGVNDLSGVGESDTSETLRGDSPILNMSDSS